MCSSASNIKCLCAYFVVIKCYIHKHLYKKCMKYSLFMKQDEL